MSGQLRKTFPNMLQKVTHRPYMKMTAVNVSPHNVPNNNSHDRKLKGPVYCFQAMLAGIYRKKPYPTHHVNSRDYCKKDESEEEGLEHQSAVNFTFLYSFKLLFFMCFDKTLRYQLGPTFFKGSSQAFLYVSDCLQRKDYEGLTEVMTPELLEKLKNDKKIPPLKSFKLLVTSAANIDVKMDKNTKIRTLQILIRTTFLINEDSTKGVNTSTSFPFFGGKVTKDSMEKLHFAQFILFKNYGETIKDTDWIIKDLHYFPLSERLTVSVKI